MTTLDKMWHKLFGEKISELERRTMTGVLESVGDKSSVLILVAVLVHFLTKVLLRDPSSPFVISRKLGDAMEKLERRLQENDKSVYVLNQDLQQFWETLNVTNYVLKSARDYTKLQEGYPPPVYRKIALVSFTGALLAFLISELLILAISLVTGAP